MSFHRRASEVCGAGLRPHQTLFWSTSDFENLNLSQRICRKLLLIRAAHS